jgi:hypothetical protein
LGRRWVGARKRVWKFVFVCVWGGGLRYGWVGGGRWESGVVGWGWREGRVMGGRGVQGPEDNLRVTRGAENSDRSAPRETLTACTRSASCER